MGQHRDNGVAEMSIARDEPVEPAEPTELSPSIRELLELFTEADENVTLDRAALAARQPATSELQPDR